MASAKKLGMAHPQILGAPVRTYRRTGGWPVILVMEGAPLIIGLIIWAASPGGPWTRILLGLWLYVITLPLHWFTMLRNRIVLHEHGISIHTAMGSADIAPYHQLYPPLVATWTNIRAIMAERDRAGEWRLEAGINQVSRYGVTFVLRSSRSVDARTLAIRPDPIGPGFSNHLVAFDLARHPRHFIADLQRLMAAQGIPGADQLAATALPPQTLTGRVADRYRQIPGDGLAGAFDRPTGPEQLPGIPPQRWALYQQIWAADPITAEQAAFYKKQHEEYGQQLAQRWAQLRDQ